ncbi:hypothetical protein [Vibrio agarivorans]|uniref:GlyGly-CTERM sorting domain-containing protein n=1 Tax=Vibrio agarivorans TaxID=153622 RepID=A0ABT7Y769_9VIBR|nr:hypothetical protein [Vibrio agarivorans]MDN2483891.1 hypothetical protein [Vibrio agarivorans]
MRHSKIYLSMLGVVLAMPVHAIEGGSHVPRDIFPHNVLLNAPVSNWDQAEEIERYCNATVFAHKWIVTSEHCVLSEPRTAYDGILDCESDELSELQTKACNVALPLIDVGDKNQDNGWREFAISRVVTTFIDRTETDEQFQEAKLLTPANPNYDSVPGENAYSYNFGSDNPHTFAFVEMRSTPYLTSTGYLAEVSEFDYALDPDTEGVLLDESGLPLNSFRMAAFKHPVTQEDSDETGMPIYDPLTDGMFMTHGVSFNPVGNAVDVSRGGDVWSGQYVGRGRNLYGYIDESDRFIVRGYGSAGVFRSTTEDGDIANAVSSFGDGGAAVTRLTARGEYDLVGVAYGSETHQEEEHGTGDPNGCSEDTCNSYDLFTYASLRYEPARNRLLYMVDAINAPKYIQSDVNTPSEVTVRLQNISKGSGTNIFSPAVPRNIRDAVSTMGGVTILDWSDSQGNVSAEACESVEPFESCYLKLEVLAEGTIGIGYEDGNQPYQTIIVSSVIPEQEGENGQPIGAPPAIPEPDVPLVPEDVVAGEEHQVLFNLHDLYREDGSPITVVAGWTTEVAFSQEDQETYTANHTVSHDDLANGWAVLDFVIDKPGTYEMTKSLVTRNQDVVYSRTYEEQVVVEETEEEEEDGGFRPTPDGGSVGLFWVFAFALMALFRKRA